MLLGLKQQAKEFLFHWSGVTEPSPLFGKSKMAVGVDRKKKKKKENLGSGKMCVPKTSQDSTVGGDRGEWLPLG